MANVQKARLAVAEEFAFDDVDQQQIERSVVAMQATFKPLQSARPSNNPTP